MRLGTSTQIACFLLMAVPLTSHGEQTETLSELTAEVLSGEVTSQWPIWDLELRDFHMRDRNWQQPIQKAVAFGQKDGSPADFHNVEYKESYGADTSATPGEHVPTVSSNREEKLLQIIYDQNALIDALSEKVTELENKLNEQH